MQNANSARKITQQVITFTTLSIQQVIIYDISLAFPL